MGIGRNEPCPCGSGKKYKKCCGSVASGQFAGHEATEAIQVTPRTTRTPRKKTAQRAKDTLVKIADDFEKEISQVSQLREKTTILRRFLDTHSPLAHLS